jgi:hypothetical protein
MTTNEIVTAVVSILALLASAASVVVSVAMGRKAQRLAEAANTIAKDAADAGRDSAEASKKSADASEKANSQARAIFDEQKLLTQRQLIIPIWDKISNLHLPDPKNPAPVHMVTGINVLELVALCVEGGMVDEDVIVRTFEDRFIQMYEAIEQCGSQPSLNGLDGKGLIRQRA